MGEENQDFFFLQALSQSNKYNENGQNLRAYLQISFDAIPLWFVNAAARFRARCVLFLSYGRGGWTCDGGAGGRSGCRRHWCSSLVLS